MDDTAIINNQEIVFWSWRGTVTAMWPSSKAPTKKQSVYDATEIRLQGAGDEKRTLMLPLPATVGADEVVSLLYARQAEEQKGPLVGVVNHTTGQRWVVAKDARPVNYKHPLPLLLVKKVDRYGLLGIAFILSALTAFALYLQSHVPFSLLNWASIWIAELALLWVLAALANRRQKRIDRQFLGEVETVLRKVAYEPIESAETAGEEAAA